MLFLMATARANRQIRGRFQGRAG